jgi:transposase
VPMSDLFGVGGQQLLQRVELPPACRARIGSAIRVLESLNFEVEVFTNLITGRLRGQRGYTAIQAIPGVGTSWVRYSSPRPGMYTASPDLASWAGLTPKHHESDTTVHRGRITKQGSTLVRWAAVEAVQCISTHHRLGQFRDQVATRRGRNIGVGAAARELITLVFYGLRDGHIRCLHHTSA